MEGFDRPAANMAGGDDPIRTYGFELTDPGLTARELDKVEFAGFAVAEPHA